MPNKTPTKFSLLLPTVLEVVVPTAGYFILHKSGVGDFWALSIAGGVAGISALVNTARRKRLDAVGVLILVEVALSMILLFVTRDPRIILLKPSFYSAVTGLYVLSTLFAQRPFFNEAGRIMAGKGDPRREAAYERTWNESSQFRMLQKRMTALWGAGFLAEAALRAWVVLDFSIKQSVLLAHVPAIAVIAALVLITHLQVPKIRALVKTEYDKDILSQHNKSLGIGRGAAA